MKKMPCLFVRDFTDPRRPALTRDVMPGCEWVLAGEGLATKKWDGTACLVRGGQLFKRYDAKRGKQPPPGWEACGEPDEVTGHHPGWLAVGADPGDAWHREVLADALLYCPDGTYELCGPRIGANPERLRGHVLLRHGEHVYAGCPRDFDGLREWLRHVDAEGVVFHRGDGAMAKIRKADFGYRRGDGT